MQNVAIITAPLARNLIDRAQPIKPDDIDGSRSSNNLPAITPEIVTVIESAASTFVGKKVRVVSVRIAPQRESSAWAGHRLTLIHGSHNLVQRRH